MYLLVRILPRNSEFWWLDFIVCSLLQTNLEPNLDGSDLEDALGSPNETVAALVNKVRRKSGLSTYDKELMRIVGQHLHSIGLKV